MTLINRYTRSKLSPEQVYIFPITLCDNEVDRDFERFTISALHRLGTLFLGKTGIFDHNMSAAGQNARIFQTWVETDESRLTSHSERYTALKAKAYMVRTDRNKALIDEIDAGIKKEVSVGCSVKKSVCSVCGKDMKTGECTHIKGRIYGGKLCCGILSEPTDAYEWSFVAVPSQREAGVTKSFLKKEEKKTELMKAMKECESELTLTKSQTEQLCDYIGKLEQYEQEAKAYRNSLVSGIERLCLLVMPKVNVGLFTKGLDCLSVEKLEILKSGLEKQAEKIIPPRLQLKSEKSGSNADRNMAFRI